MDNLKVKSFIQAAPFESRLTNTFFIKLGDEPHEMLYRINPLLFAKKYGLDEKKTMNIFILASCAGIFDLLWNLFCPTCGYIIKRDKAFHSLNSGPNFCALCNRTVPAALDNNVEVVFRFHPDIFKAEVNPFENITQFLHVFFYRGVKNNNEIVGLIKGINNDFIVHAPGETKKMTIKAEPGMVCRLIAINLNENFYMYINNKAGHNSPIHIIADEKGFSQKEVHLNRGTITLEIKNKGREKIVITLIQSKPDELHLQEQKKSGFYYFLNGKMLLNNTTFRNLYKIKNVPGNLKLSIQSLTFLFSDLSPAGLHNRNEDSTLYDLLQNNFGILEEIADRFNGAVIKSMADYIMVSFLTPEDGFLAALSLLNKSKTGEKGNSKNKTLPCLKIGLHEGPALVINRDGHLDYFGKTVSIAAQLLGLAGPDEFFFSHAIFHQGEIKKIIKKQKNRIKLYKKRIKLKGPEEKMMIYKIIFTG